MGLINDKDQYERLDMLIRRRATWSKFNYLYFSRKHNKYLLFNSLSNAFIEINNITLLGVLKKIKDNNETEMLSEFPSLYRLLSWG